MPDSNARQFLAALADRSAPEQSDTRAPRPDVPYEELIRRAEAATEDLESATAFLADHDLEALEWAVDRADDELSTTAGRGREALETLRELQWALDGRQFQSARGSSLGDEGLADAR